MSVSIGPDLAVAFARAPLAQAQMEAMKQASDAAHKMLTDGKKALGLGTRSGPGAMGPQRDAKEVELLKKQEAILRTAVLSGEGRSPSTLRLIDCRQEAY